MQVFLLNILCCSGCRVKIISSERRKGNPHFSRLPDLNWNVSVAHVTANGSTVIFSKSSLTICLLISCGVTPLNFSSCSLIALNCISAGSGLLIFCSSRIWLSVCFICFTYSLFLETNSSSDILPSKLYSSIFSRFCFNRSICFSSREISFLLSGIFFIEDCKISKYSSKMLSMFSEDLFINSAITSFSSDSASPKELHEAAPFFIL